MTENFSRSEFACRCGCGEDRIHPELVDRLQIARDTYGRSMSITSGCRCSAHNAHVGGSPTSSHLVRDDTNFAADILVKNSADRMKLVKCLLGAGFRRIGPAKGFIHIDIDPQKPSDVMFTYDS